MYHALSGMYAQSMFTILPNIQGTLVDPIMQREKLKHGDLIVNCLRDLDLILQRQRMEPLMQGGITTVSP